MLEYKIGDLMVAGKLGKVDIIAHCANCFCTFGSGIAPQIKNNFPWAWEADQETVRGDAKKLGTVSYGMAEPEDWTDTVSCPDVFNLYGQYGFSKRNEGKRDLDYNALFDSLSEMTKLLEKWGAEKQDTVIGLPLIGCGLAGGDWEIVELLIKKTLCKAGFNVIVYIRNEKEVPASVAMDLLVDYTQELNLYSS